MARWILVGSGFPLPRVLLQQRAEVLRIEGKGKVLVVSHSLPARLLCPWNSPGKNTGVGSRSLLQGIFPIKGSNQGVPALQADSLPSEPPGKPFYRGKEKHN